MLIARTRQRSIISGASCLRLQSQSNVAGVKISYQMAAFERNGKNLIHFAGWKQHVSLYPVPAGSEAFERQIAKYVDGKGTLKFPLDEPLPIKLIERVVKLHLQVNKEMTKGESK